MEVKATVFPEGVVRAREESRGVLSPATTKKVLPFAMREETAEGRIEG